MRDRLRHRGHALIGTMIFLVLGMLLWAAVYQQSAGQLRVEKALQVRTERADRLKRVTAWALTLLETGQPPVGWTGAYRCRMILDGQTYLTTFWKSWTEPGVYWVQVSLKAPSYTSYPLAPQSFATE